MANKAQRAAICCELLQSGLLNSKEVLTLLEEAERRVQEELQDDIDALVAANYLVPSPTLDEVKASLNTPETLRNKQLYVSPFYSLKVRGQIHSDWVCVDDPGDENDAVALKVSATIADKTPICGCEIKVLADMGCQCGAFQSEMELAKSRT